MLFVPYGIQFCLYPIVLASCKKPELKITNAKEKMFEWCNENVLLATVTQDITILGHYSN